MEAWNAMAEDDKIELTYQNYLLQFGSTTGRPILMQHNGLLPTIEGVKRTYDCFDVNFRKHSSVKWNVMYDPDDMSRALAVNEEQTLQFLLEEKYVQPMALKDRKEGDSEQLQRVREFNRELIQEVTEFRAETAEQSRGILEMVPELETLKKLAITDSKGQHKNERNKARLAPPQPSPHWEGDVGQECPTPVRVVNQVQAEITETSYLDKL
ncbi:MAG TPA: hypothetical protein GXZ87_07510 [Bacteroidales bacterium]|nr:hypothetical protein [Bacteroidales bacterium]